MFVDIIKVFML